MTKSLEEILEYLKQDLEAPLIAARAELAELDARRERLAASIAKAEAMQASVPPDGTLKARPFAAAREAERLTLHEALAVVLREEGNRWMSARELATTVNERGLYQKKDRTLVEASQVHARTKNYLAVFEKHDSKIRLRNG